MASWKKIIVSGSIAEFNHISASGDIVPVSDGVSNLGSAGQEFQDLFIDGTANIDSLVADTANIDGGTDDGITSLTAAGDLDIGSHGFRAQTLTADNQTSGNVTIYGANGLLTEDSDLTFSGATLSATNLTTTGTIKNMALVSGSSVSTGSFGRLQTVQANASIGGNIVTIGGALTTAGDFTTQNNNVTINAAGADRSITLNESLTIGDGNDGTLTFSAASKTLTVEDTSVVNQDLTTDANVTFADVSATGTVTVGGDLVVNGDTTTVATTNLTVQDAFGFFATGSAGSNVDAGIIVQSGSFVNSGSAFYHDINAERWSVAKSVAATSTAATPLESVVTVKEPGDNGAPADADVEYGVGEMFINSNGTIWIYS